MCVYIYIHIYTHTHICYLLRVPVTRADGPLLRRGADYGRFPKFHRVCFIVVIVAIL